jgi:hypothetical protein
MKKHFQLGTSVLFILLISSACMVQPLAIPENDEFSEFRVSVYEDGSPVADYSISRGDALFSDILEISRREGSRDWIPANYAPVVLVKSSKPYLRLNFDENSVVVSLYENDKFDQKIVQLENSKVFNRLRDARRGEGQGILQKQ